MSNEVKLSKWFDFGARTIFKVTNNGEEEEEEEEEEEKTDSELSIDFYWFVSILMILGSVFLAFLQIFYRSKFYFSLLLWAHKEGIWEIGFGFKRLTVEEEEKTVWGCEYISVLYY